MNLARTRPAMVFLGFVWGTIFGFSIAPSTAHAVSDYSSSIARVARAAERIADTLEKAAR